FLARKIVADEPRSHAGAQGDCAHGGALQAAFGNAVQRRLDQVLSPPLLALAAEFAAGGAVGHWRRIGRVRQVGPPSQAMHSASASKVLTTQMAACVLGKPATAITSRGAVGSTLRLRPLEAWNSSASPCTSVMPRPRSIW